MQSFRIVLWSLPLIIVMSCSGDKQSTPPGTTRETDDTSEVRKGSIYSVDIPLQDQFGHTVPWQSLRGKVRVMAMVFTNCESACPRITQDIKDAEALLKDVPKKDEIGYTLISFDTKRDSASRLREYYNERQLDPNWILLRGEEDDIQIIGNLFDVKYKAMPNGAFSHQNVILVFDRAGQLIFRREGLGKDPKELAEKVKSVL